MSGKPYSTISNSNSIAQEALRQQCFTDGDNDKCLKTSCKGFATNHGPVDPNDKYKANTSISFAQQYNNASHTNANKKASNNYNETKSLHEFDGGWKNTQEKTPTPSSK